ERHPSSVLRLSLLALFVEDRGGFRGTDRAQGEAGPLVEDALLLRPGQGCAAVLAALGKLLDRPLLQLHRLGVYALGPAPRAPPSVASSTICPPSTEEAPSTSRRGRGRRSRTGALRPRSRAIRRCPARTAPRCSA